MREVGTVLFELAFKLFDQPGNERPLLSEGGNDMWVGHPHMVGWPLAVLNAVVVPFARCGGIRPIAVSGR
jgi:hypothetical protein